MPYHIPEPVSPVESSLGSLMLVIEVTIVLMAEVIVLKGVCECDVQAGVKNKDM